MSGIFGNPNDLALNMVTFLPLALMTALSRRYSATRRLAATGFAVLMLATVVFTKSRGGVLGLGMMLAAFLFLGRRIRPGVPAAALVAVLLATPFLPGVVLEPHGDDRQRGTGQAAVHGIARSAARSARRKASNAFLERPLTGVGAGQFKNYNPPGRRERWRETHNALLQVAADLGLFGFAAFAFLVVCGAIAASRRAVSCCGRAGGAPTIRSGAR